MASLDYSRGGEAVRKIRSPFYSRCDIQLKRVKTGNFLHRIQHVPINIFNISHNKHVFTVLALIFVKKEKKKKRTRHQKGVLNY